CSPALFVQPGLQKKSERDDQYIFVSQHSRKPNVMCSFVLAKSVVVLLNQLYGHLLMSLNVHPPQHYNQPVKTFQEIICPLCREYEICLAAFPCCSIVLIYQLPI